MHYDKILPIVLHLHFLEENMSQKSKSKQHHNQSKAEHNRAIQNRSKTNQPVKKERGFWLTFVLVIMALHGIVATLFYTSAKAGAAPNARTWILTLMILHCVLDIVAVAGIWFWKKWALYLYGFSTILAMIAGLLTGYGMYSVFYMIMPFVILGWLLRTKWDYLE
jgi:hypothetical protein